MRVIDLGCGADGRSTTAFAPRSWTIVGVDLLPPAKVAHAHPGFSYVKHTACDLGAFPDGAFDLAISVGLLEHVTDPADFAAAAAEIQRVARQYALVVPYRYAWYEPHYIVPFFPVLPPRIQSWLVRALNLKGQRAAVRGDSGYVARHTRWRTNREYREAFPGSTTALTPTRETVLISRSLEAP